MHILHRVLVVDNYDSFTYNLVHGLGLCVGRGVSVVMNDDSKFLSLISGKSLKEHFDLIVLSPGPGNPYTDIGCVTEYIIDSFLSTTDLNSLPVLFGVCMGFEAIGVRCGVNLVKTIPRHGVRWPIHVNQVADGSTLFDGVPSVIEQVRYHSLILDPVSLEANPDLIVTSFAFDSDPSGGTQDVALPGPRNAPSVPNWIQRLSLHQLSPPTHSPDVIKIPMSFRHIRLPIFAVQFHPESVWSDYGQRLIENVVRLSGHSHVTSDNEVLPEKFSLEKIGQKKSQNCRHILTVPSGDLHWWTQAVYSQLFHCADISSVWLDSPVGTSGRWSFLAGGRQAGDSLFAVFTQRGKEVALSEGQWAHFPLAGESVDVVYKELFEWIALGFDSPPAGGPPVAVPAIFSLLGYECTSPIGNDLESALLVADRIVAVDNETGHVYALTVGDDDWISAGELAEIRPEVRPAASLAAPEPVFTVHDSKSQYIEKVNCCQLAIEQGESYELCLTTRISAASIKLNPLHTYSKLRALNPAPNSCFFHVASDDVCLLMASPERFLKIDHGVAQVKPIKGTRRRGRTDSEDKEIVKDLQSSTKDSAENLMIVDLVRNDLTRVCRSVSCPVLMQIESYPPYHQLVSTVEGSVRNDRLAEAVFALFPAGSMTGAPKVRSMQLLEAIEGTPRGIGYSGAVGVASPCSSYVDLAVVIRSILIDGKADVVTLGVGGAVLALSDPLEEWREMILKARRNLSGIAASINAPGVILKYAETESMFIRARLASGANVVTSMRYERGRGIWLWDQHVDRITSGIGDAILRSDIEESMLESIRAAVSAVDPDKFKNRVEVQEGPFSGISDIGWVPVAIGDIHACRIRCEALFDEAGDVRFITYVEPLIYDNPKRLTVTKIRVDSGDSALTCKRSDWYVPGVDRASTLLVDECDYVTETGIANIAAFIDGEWKTPSATTTALLPGILRGALLKNGLIKEECINIKDLRDTATRLVCFNSVRGVFSIHLD